MYELVLVATDGYEDITQYEYFGYAYQSSELTRHNDDTYTRGCIVNMETGEVVHDWKR